MMSSCLSGGSRPYGFDLDVVKSTRASSSSPSSTLSESTSSPRSISTRRTRTPRKRPNQAYNEAAALLSTAYPNVFSPTKLTSEAFRFLEDESVFLIHHHPREEQKLPSFRRERPRPIPIPSPSCRSRDENEIQSKAAARLYDEYEEDFDAESMLDEEIEEGIIDSIMGEKSGSGEAVDNAVKLGHSWGRSPMALLGLGGRLGVCYGTRRAGASAWRDAGEVNWRNFPTVDINEISSKLNPGPAAEKKKKKKKKKVEKPPPDTNVARSKNVRKPRVKEEDSDSPAMLRLGVKKCGLMLKLDHGNVLEAWAGRGSPFTDDGGPASDVNAAGYDVGVTVSKRTWCLL